MRFVRSQWSDVGEYASLVPASDADGSSVRNLEGLELRSAGAQMFEVRHSFLVPIHYLLTLYSCRTLSEETTSERQF